MPVTREQLREFQRVLRRSNKPLDATDNFYVSRLHGTDAEDVVERLSQEIEDTNGSGLYYFTGQRGTGKSTELRRLKTSLDGKMYRCVLFDSLEYLNEAKPVSAEMIMLMVAAGLSEWIAKEYHLNLADESVVQRFLNWLQSEVEIESVTLPQTGIKISIKGQQDSISQRIQTLGSRRKFHQELLNFIALMAKFVHEREKRPVVLIVDSLENLRGNPLTEDEGKMFASVAQVFSDQMESLKVTSVHMVYSVPPYLCLLENVRDNVSWYALASVRVYDDPKKNRRKPRTQAPENNVMRLLMSKRWANWREVLQEDALDTLALLSGGDLRQFILRLLVDVLHEAQFALDRLPLQKDDQILQNIAEACATEMLQLTVREEWPLLIQVTRENNIVSQGRDQLKTLAHLLDTKVILNYRNGRDWYDIHPSLWAKMDEQFDIAQKSTSVQ